MQVHAYSAQASAAVNQSNQSNPAYSDIEKDKEYFFNRLYTWKASVW
jgi:hypothetical protein